MSMPGMTELLVIFGIVMVLFGGSRLPKLGGAIGESIRNFRRGLKDGQDEDKSKLASLDPEKTKLNPSPSTETR